jgi:hypothetical protein
MSGSTRMADIAIERLAPLPRNICIRSFSGIGPFKHIRPLATQGRFSGQ